MSLSGSQIALLFATTTVIVLAAHVMGYLFAAMRQPAVIGEIVAGLLLGPTLLGLLAPSVEETLFGETGATAVVLAALGQFGLLMLMFLTGGEMQVRSAPAERRTVSVVAGVGLIVPFAASALVVQALDHRDFVGPAGSSLTFALVFGIAVAVTSIPVISRIMMDLGLLGTPFARVVLAVAAIEDILLYGVLAVVLSLANVSGGDEYGLWAVLGVDSTAWSVTYHVAVTLIFCGALLIWGGRVVTWLLGHRINIVERRSPIAFRLAFLLCAVLACIALGINPIFGALLAGVAVRPTDQKSWESFNAIRQFSVAFFIPVYFVIVGLKLDLIRNFDPLFFAWFILFCCAVKAISIWGGARLAGEPPTRATDLAVALNARGGPGIVLATVTLSAGVINDSFFTSVVLLSVLTSQIAGAWLHRRTAALGAADMPAGGAPAPAPGAPPAGPTAPPAEPALREVHR